MKKIVLIFLLVFLIFIDQLVKWWVINFHPILIFENHGIIFGFIQNPIIIYLLLGIGFLVLIWLVIGQNKFSFNFWKALPIILISAGALSNILDRFYRGFVVDYFSFFGLNYFNISDIMIISGVLLYALQIFKYKK